MPGPGTAPDESSFKSLQGALFVARRWLVGRGRAGLALQLGTVALWFFGVPLGFAKVALRFFGIAL
jgi:hypothetical protein